MDQQLQNALDELNTAARSAREEMEKRLDQFEIELNHAQFGFWRNPSAKPNSVSRQAFNTFIRHGREGLEPHEIKDLVLSDDTKGGFLAPADFVAEVLKNIVQFSPVRQAARVGVTSSGEVKIPRRTGTLTASWVGEIETRPSSEPSYGQIAIPINEGACYVDISNQQLEDAAVDMFAELAGDFAEEFGRLEGEAFVSGNGVKKPLGFMADTNIAYTPSGSAADITADSLIDVLYALKPFYRNRSTWMMNGLTLAKVRKMKDGQGQWLWRPGLAEGQPETILGRPLVEAVDMPDVAAGTYPIAIGDFQSGYRIYDRTILAVLRDHFRWQRPDRRDFTRVAESVAASRSRKHCES
jgi:HK97 family phage major capsid protein